MQLEATRRIRIRKDSKRKTKRKKIEEAGAIGAHISYRMKGKGEPHKISLVAKRMTLGRHKDNDICIDHDTVSRHHAVINYSHDGYNIEDCGSTNGLLVNDKQRNKHKLKHRDIVKIGEIDLLFLERG